MKALLLKEKGKLAIVDMAFDEKLGPDDVRIQGTYHRCLRQ